MQSTHNIKSDYDDDYYKIKSSDAFYGDESARKIWPMKGCQTFNVPTIE